MVSYSSFFGNFRWLCILVSLILNDSSIYGVSLVISILLVVVVSPLNQFVCTVFILLDSWSMSTISISTDVWTCNLGLDVNPSSAYRYPPTAYVGSFPLRFSGTLYNDKPNELVNIFSSSNTEFPIRRSSLPPYVVGMFLSIIL